MKAHELYRLWSEFETMMESSLPDEKKYDMGREWLAALPPRQLCVSSTLSYDIVREAMLGRLNDLKDATRTEPPKEAEDPRGQEQVQGDKRRPKSVRKTKQDT